MNDTSLMECPSRGKVRVPDRDVFLSPIPGVEDLPEFDAGVGFRCLECGDRIWKDNHHWDHLRRYPTGLRP